MEDNSRYFEEVAQINNEHDKIEFSKKLKLYKLI